MYCDKCIESISVKQLELFDTVVDAITYIKMVKSLKRNGLYDMISGRYDFSEHKIFGKHVLKSKQYESLDKNTLHIHKYLLKYMLANKELCNVKFADSHEINCIKHKSDKQLIYEPPFINCEICINFYAYIINYLTKYESGKLIISCSLYLIPQHICNINGALYFIDNMKTSATIPIYDLKIRLMVEQIAFKK